MDAGKSQSSYLEKRKRLLKSWQYVGPALLLAAIGLATWIFVTSPLLINPYDVTSRIESGTIGQSTLEMMTTLFPLITIFLFLPVFVVIGIMHAAPGKEKRYLERKL